MRLILRKAKAASGGPGPGWSPVPGSKHGGYRKRRGRGWDYWYPKEHRGKKAAGLEERLHADTRHRQKAGDDLHNKTFAPRGVSARKEWKAYAAGDKTIHRAHLDHHETMSGPSQGLPPEASGNRDYAQQLIERYHDTDDDHEASKVRDFLHANFQIHPEAHRPMKKSVRVGDGYGGTVRFSLRKGVGAPGPGWEAIPGGKHGGWRKRGAAGHYVYKYPSKEAASAAVGHHQAKMAHHRKRRDHHFDKQDAMDETWDHHVEREQHHGAQHDTHREIARAAQHYAEHGHGHPPWLDSFDSHHQRHDGDYLDDERVRGQVFGDPLDPDKGYEFMQRGASRTVSVRHGTMRHGALSNDSTWHEVGRGLGSEARRLMSDHVAKRHREAQAKANTARDAAAGSTKGSQRPLFKARATGVLSSAARPGDMAPVGGALGPPRIEAASLRQDANTHEIIDGRYRLGTHQCRFQKGADGLAVLSISGPKMPLPYHMVLGPQGSWRTSMAKAREAIELLREGRVPTEGVFRRIGNSLTPRWGEKTA